MFFKNFNTINIIFTITHYITNKLKINVTPSGIYSQLRPWYIPKVTVRSVIDEMRQY